MENRRRRLYEVIEIGAGDDRLSRAYDFISALLIVLFLVISILETFESVQRKAGNVLNGVEIGIVVFFTVDYILRLYTARYKYPEKNGGEAVRRYMLSFGGLVDLLSFLPFYLPFFFPAGAVAFRMFRVIRIFRLFRINAYYDSLNVITEVLNSKKQQLVSSVFIVLVLMLASSLCMYSVEHEAQPDIFRNAFSGIWWAVSTLLTVGYGDIYPITTLGKVLGTIITFLGVGVVAIPTGIISAGFVEQYTELKKRSEYLKESDVLFVKVCLTDEDPWTGKRIEELVLPHGLMVGAVLRERHALLPREDVLLQKQDIVVLGTEPVPDGTEIDLKEIILSAQSPWVGRQVRDLDISRRSLIVMIKRDGTVIRPHGHDVFLAGDKVYIYTENRMHQATKITL